MKPDYPLIYFEEYRPHAHMTNYTFTTKTFISLLLAFPPLVLKIVLLQNAIKNIFQQNWECLAFYL